MAPAAWRRVAPPHLVGLDGRRIVKIGDDYEQKNGDGDHRRHEEPSYEVIGEPATLAGSLRSRQQTGKKLRWPPCRKKQENEARKVRQFRQHSRQLFLSTIDEKI